MLDLLDDHGTRFNSHFVLSDHFLAQLSQISSASSTATPFIQYHLHSSPALQSSRSPTIGTMSPLQLSRLLFIPPHTTLSHIQNGVPTPLRPHAKRAWGTSESPLHSSCGLKGAAETHYCTTSATNDMPSLKEGVTNLLRVLMHHIQAQSQATAMERAKWSGRGG